MNALSEIKDASAYVYYNSLMIEGMTHYATNNCCQEIRVGGVQQFLYPALAFAGVQLWYLAETP